MFIYVVSPFKRRFSNGVLLIRLSWEAFFPALAEAYHQNCWHTLASYHTTSRLWGVLVRKGESEMK